MDMEKTDKESKSPVPSQGKEVHEVPTKSHRCLCGENCPCGEKCQCKENCQCTKISSGSICACAEGSACPCGSECKCNEESTCLFGQEKK